jgi:NAD(P)-dependent dehydrogenase (short-subunit alcohol dehydrogenase family)
MERQVAVIIGVGGMGLAIARRIGSGRTLVLADFDPEALDGAAAQLRGEGHEVVAQAVDVGDAASVAGLAAVAAEQGPVLQVAHTAGLSPAQAPVDAILRVDLLGVIHVLAAFQAVIAPGGAGVVIASMAGHLAAGVVPAELAAVLASTPASQLLDLPLLGPDQVPNPGMAYAVAKRANHLSVAAHSPAWGRRGARINSISPGVISTPMGNQELDSESGEQMRAMVAMSATGRLGTPDDIAAAAAFLLDPGSSFITGTDLLVDGGTVAAVMTSGLGAAAS